MMKMNAYEIWYGGPDNWEVVPADSGVNLFDTEQAAWDYIVELRQLDDEWVTTEYDVRVVPADSLAAQTESAVMPWGNRGVDTNPDPC